MNFENYIYFDEDGALTEEILDSHFPSDVASLRSRDGLESCGIAKVTVREEHKNEVEAILDGYTLDTHEGELTRNIINCLAGIIDTGGDNLDCKVELSSMSKGFFGGRKQGIFEVRCVELTIDVGVRGKYGPLDGNDAIVRKDGKYYLLVEDGLTVAEFVKGAYEHA